MKKMLYRNVFGFFFRFAIWRGFFKFIFYISGLYDAKNFEKHATLKYKCLDAAVWMPEKPVRLRRQARKANYNFFLSNN
jgi:hypothetical protein